MPNKKNNPNFQLSQTKKAIEVLGEKINKTLFNGEVEPYLTTIQPQGRKNCIGWATVDKRWSSKDKKKIEYRELNICAEYLHQPEVIFECIIHELVHHDDGSLVAELHVLSLLLVGVDARLLLVPKSLLAGGLCLLLSQIL